MTEAEVKPMLAKLVREILTVIAEDYERLRYTPWDKQTTLSYLGERAVKMRKLYDTVATPPDAYPLIEGLEAIVSESAK